MRDYYPVTSFVCCSRVRKQSNAVIVLNKQQLITVSLLKQWLVTDEVITVLDYMCQHGRSILEADTGPWPWPLTSDLHMEAKESLYCMWNYIWLSQRGFLSLACAQLFQLKQQKRWDTRVTRQSQEKKKSDHDQSLKKRFQITGDWMLHNLLLICSRCNC